MFLQKWVPYVLKLITSAQLGYTIHTFHCKKKRNLKKCFLIIVDLQCYDDFCCAVTQSYMCARAHTHTHTHTHIYIFSLFFTLFSIMVYPKD